MRLTGPIFCPAAPFTHLHMRLCGFFHHAYLLSCTQNVNVSISRFISGHIYLIGNTHIPLLWIAHHLHHLCFHLRCLYATILPLLILNKQFFCCCLFCCLFFYMGMVTQQNHSVQFWFGAESCQLSRITGCFYSLCAHIILKDEQSLFTETDFRSPRAGKHRLVWERNECK